MSLLSKLANLNKADNTTAKREMTPLEMEQCKEALRRDHRGYNVQPNKFDFNQPYRVAINYENKWYNYGNFTNVNVAAAIGTIVSVAFFGEKAKAGEYDPAIAEADEEFIAWMADTRNAEVIAKASGEQKSVHDGGTLTDTTSKADVAENPF